MCKKLFYLMSFLFVLGMVSTKVLAAVDPNLVAQYTFDSSNGADSSGNGHDCVQVGAVSYVPDADRIGTVLSLDGTAGNYLNAGGNAGWASFTKSVTYCAWFKVNQFTSSMQCVIGTAGPYRLSRNALTGKMRLWHDPSPPRGTLAGISDVNDGKWHHGCGVVSGDGVNSMTAYLYIDGNLEKSATYTGNGGKLLALTSDLFIGGDSISYPNREWNGLIDDVRFYNKALARKEVLEAAGIRSAKDQAPDGATNLSVSQTLTWMSAFQESSTFRVYYGTDSASVMNAQPGSLLGTTLVTTAVNVTSLTRTFNPATTYYWRVDVVNGSNVYPDEKVHTFSTRLPNSTNFLPIDGKTELPKNQVVLQWTAGSLPVTYNVYLGTSQTAVSGGTGGTKVSSLQTATSYTPAGILENATYYWRIEDVGTTTVSSPVMSFSTIGDVDPNLVGWWKLDQVGASDAADSSGNQRTGTFLGTASIVTDGTGAALSLNGTTDYVNVTGYKGVLGTKSRTTCFWIKTSGQGAIMSWGTNVAGQKWHVQVDPTFEIRTGVSGGYVVGVKKVNDNLWHHIAATIENDGSPNSNEILTYIDGVKEVTTNVAKPMDTLSGNDVAIGNWIPENDYFTGLIKDARIYNKALSQKEILEIAGTNTAQGQTPDGTTGLAANVTLSWVAAFDQSRTFNVYYGKNSADVDASQPGSHPNTVLVQNHPSTSLAVTLEPGTTYYWRVDVVNGANIYKDLKIHTFTTAVANSYNFKPTDGQTGLAPNKVVFSWSAGSLPVTGYNVYLGTIQADVANGAIATKVASLLTDTSYRPASLAETTTYYWRIEDVRTPISSSAVMSFTTSTNIDPNLVGWWNFEDGTATTVTDVSGNAHTGTLKDQAAVVNDLEKGNVLSLDGTGDYLAVTGYKGISGAASRTICAWIKTSKTGTNYQGIVAWGQNTAGKSWDFVVYDSKLRQMAYNNNANAQSTVADGNWHHVASVFAGGSLNTVKLYVDGAQDTVTGSSATVDTGNVRDLRIGDTDSLGSRQFKGMLEDVRLYDRVLTAEEISELYHQGENFVTIDTMEDYNDTIKPIDGVGGWRDNDYNPEVGGHTFIGKTANLDPVKNGKQSLKLSYDNSDWMALKYHNSETVKIFDTPQDWSFATSEKKVKILTIPVRGLASNGKDKLYVALEDDAAHSWTVYHTDPNVLINETWQIWEISTDEFKNKGVNMARIKKIFLGVGNRNELNFLEWLTGTVYFDNLTLNPPRCRPEFSSASDITKNCVVDLADLQVMANNWLKSDLSINPLPVSADGLKVQWTFDAGNANDSSGNGNNGTLSPSGATVIDDPIKGKVMNFDGTGYVSMPIAAFTSISNQVTVSLWQNGGSAQPIASAIINGDDGADHRILNVHLPWSSGAVIFDAGINATYAYDRISKNATASEYKGKWNHWAFTKDTTSGQMKVYCNGQLWNSGTGMTKTMAGITRFNLGASAAGTTSFYIGMVEDLRIYSRVLSQGEIVTLAGYSQPLVIPVNASVNLKVKGLAGAEIIDYRDFSVLAQSWMNMVLWP